MDHNEDMDKEIGNLETLLNELKEINDSYVHIDERSKFQGLPRKDVLLYHNTMEVKQDDFYNKIFSFSKNVEDKLLTPQERKRLFKSIGRTDNEKF